jgi:hypothetical protein
MILWIRLDLRLFICFDITQNLLEILVLGHLLRHILSCFMSSYEACKCGLCDTRLLSSYRDVIGALPTFLGRCLLPLIWTQSFQWHLIIISWDISYSRGIDIGGTWCHLRWRFCNRRVMRQLLDWILMLWLCTWTTHTYLTTGFGPSVLSLDLGLPELF